MVYIPFSPNHTGKQGGVYTSPYHTTRVYMVGIHSSLPYYPGYTLGITPSLLMHAATQWYEQCPVTEPWAQSGD